MIRIIIKRIFTLIFWTTGLALLFLFLARLTTEVTTRKKILALDSIPDKTVAVVFGAGLRRDGYPTAVLRDRVETGTRLFLEGKVDVLLMSGDNRFENYDEPTAMHDYAIRLGVPAGAIVRDYAGQRTYDTCYRAREIFGVNEAILVTQEFHLPRAIYTCDALGVESYGIAADLRNYWRGALTFWKLRELIATTIAFWDIHISKPLPILGEPEPIFLKAQ